MQVLIAIQLLSIIVLAGIPKMINFVIVVIINYRLNLHCHVQTHARVFLYTSKTASSVQSSSLSCPLSSSIWGLFLSFDRRNVLFLLSQQKSCVATLMMQLLSYLGHQILLSVHDYQ